MGYTKVVQYGDIIEVSNYDKYVHTKIHRFPKARNRRRSGAVFFRSQFSVKRAKTSFIRIAKGTLHRFGTPTFITLTNYEEVSITLAYAYLRTFFRNLQKTFGDITYISVPEWQPTSGFIHFHCLVWGDFKGFDKEERNSRVFQRCWARGYVDVLNATDAGEGIAFYMAKYMSKAYTDTRLGNRRAYSSSYNVSRPLSVGSNTLSTQLTQIIPVDVELTQTYTYGTQFLGDCEFIQYKINKYDTH